LGPLKPSVELFDRRWKVAKPVCLVSVFRPLAPPLRASLPQGWSDADIVSPGLAGSANVTIVASCSQGVSFQQK
jgi:hypothetical protein